MEPSLGMHEAMGQALVERGLATSEDVQSDRAALEARLAGEEPATTAQPTAPAATASQPARQVQPAEVDPMDALAFAGPTSPSAYSFGQVPRGVMSSPEQELSFRTFFHQEGIPAAIGSEVGKLWNKAVANPPDEARLEQTRQECSVALNRLWGTETRKNLAVAQAEVQRMAKSNPEIVAMLERSGLGNSPWLASTLFNLARAKGRA